MTTPNPTNHPPPEWDRLLSASQKNDPPLIRHLIISCGVSPSHSNPVHQSALHIASLWGHVDCVSTLLELGAPTNVCNSITGATPLHSTVQSSKLPLENRIECARLLIESGGDDLLNLADRFGATPGDCLEDEIESGMVELTDEVAKFRDLLGGGTSLIEESGVFGMIDDGNVEAVRGLLLEQQQQQKKETETEEEDGGSSPTFLTEADEKKGYAPLHYAIDKLLIACQEADEVEVKEDGMVWCQNLVAIVESLLEGGADPDAKATPKRRRRGGGGPETDEDLLGGVEDGTNLPLHRICVALSTLYASSNSTNSSTSQSEESSTLLLEQTATLLLTHSSTVHPPTTFLLHDSCRRSNLPMVRFLIDIVGVDPSVPGRQGLTPLHFAARSGRVGVVEYLLTLKNGNGGADGYGGEGNVVDLTIKDDRGMTALDAARVNGKVEVVALLEGGE